MFQSLAARTKPVLVLILAIFTLSAQAVSLNSSTFVYSQSVANITFTLTAVSDTNDLIFRLSAPAEYDWVAVGVGPSMKGALIFMVYPAKNGTGNTAKYSVTRKESRRLTLQSQLRYSRQGCRQVIPNQYTLQTLP
jgi:hypothetical protein